MSSTKPSGLVSVLCTIMTLGCAAQGEFVRTDVTSTHAPKLESFDIPVSVSRPGRPFREIGIATATKQATTVYGEVKEADLIPELKRQGRLMGADALVDLKFESFTKAAVLSDRSKHALRATALAIIFTDSEIGSKAGSDSLRAAPDSL